MKYLQTDKRAAKAQHVDPGATLQRREHIHLYGNTKVRQLL